MGMFEGKSAGEIHKSNQQAAEAESAEAARRRSDEARPFFDALQRALRITSSSTASTQSNQSAEEDSSNYLAALLQNEDELQRLAQPKSNPQGPSVVATLSHSAELIIQDSQKLDADALKVVLGPGYTEVARNFHYNRTESALEKVGAYQRYLLYSKIRELFDAYVAGAFFDRYFTDLRADRVDQDDPLLFADNNVKSSEQKTLEAALKSDIDYSLVKIAYLDRSAQAQGLQAFISSLLGPRAEEHLKKHLLHVLDEYRKSWGLLEAGDTEPEVYQGCFFVGSYIGDKAKKDIIEKLLASYDGQPSLQYPNPFSDAFASESVGIDRNMLEKALKNIFSTSNLTVDALLKKIVSVQSESEQALTGWKDKFDRSYQNEKAAKNQARDSYRDFAAAWIEGQSEATLRGIELFALLGEEAQKLPPKFRAQAIVSTVVTSGIGQMPVSDHLLHLVRTRYIENPPIRSKMLPLIQVLVAQGGHADIFLAGKFLSAIPDADRWPFVKSMLGALVPQTPLDLGVYRLLSRHARTREDAGHSLVDYFVTFSVERDHWSSVIILLSALLVKGDLDPGEKADLAAAVAVVLGTFSDNSWSIFPSGFHADVQKLAKEHSIEATGQVPLLTNASHAEQSADEPSIPSRPASYLSNLVWGQGPVDTMSAHNDNLGNRVDSGDKLYPEFSDSDNDIENQWASGGGAASHAEQPADQLSIPSRIASYVSNLVWGQGASGGEGKTGSFSSERGVSMTEAPREPSSSSSNDLEKPLLGAASPRGY